MGFMRNVFSFGMGTIFGVYLAQTYTLPPLKMLYDQGLEMGKALEKAYKKQEPNPPKAKEDA